VVTLLDRRWSRSVMAKAILMRLAACFFRRENAKLVRLALIERASGSYKRQS